MFLLLWLMQCLQVQRTHQHKSPFCLLMRVSGYSVKYLESIRHVWYNFVAGGFQLETVKCQPLMKFCRVELVKRGKGLC